MTVVQGHESANTVRYVVETLLGTRWGNCWFEGDDPMTFATREEAEAAVKEHLEDVRESVAIGHLSDEYLNEDVRVISIPDSVTGQTSGVTV